MSNITVKNLKTGGTIYTGTGDHRETLITTCGGDILVKDCTFGGAQYNAIYTDYVENGITPKNITFENIDVSGTCKNNGISVCAVQEGGTITLKNCHFADVSNAFRYFNKNNVSNVTITIEDCTIDKWDTIPMWNGFGIFEDWISRTLDDAEKANRFGPEKVKVIVKNLVDIHGKKVMPEDLSVIMGTQDENQVFYVALHNGSDNVILPYDEKRYPKFEFS